jgi:lipid-A-disaccharide synthase
MPPPDGAFVARRSWLIRRMTSPRESRIFLSVAEDSADAHAAALVRTARQALPGCTFYGLTGPRLRALGVETVYDFAAHAAMLAGVFGVIGRAWRTLALVEKTWLDRRPDLVVLLDSPELNLRLARIAHRMRIPVLYYIAPQTWASRAGRNRQIARDVDRLACILPFEETYFRRQLVYADYVGHPLFETLADEHPRDDVVQRLRKSDRPVVALLPGSRAHVIDAMLPRQLEVVRRMRAAGHTVEPVVSCVSAARRPQVRRHIHQGGFHAEMVESDNASLLTAADLVLVASGTATLHVAHYRKPMVVMYDAGGLLRWPYRALGRFVIKTPHLSLVNILAGARLVPEFMPFITDTQPIADVAGQLLHDADWRELMIRQLDEIVAPLAATQPSVAVCDMMRRLLRLPK